jgi:hypothetical protein
VPSGALVIGVTTAATAAENPTVSPMCCGGRGGARRGDERRGRQGHNERPPVGWSSRPRVGDVVLSGWPLVSAGDRSRGGDGARGKRIDSGHYAIVADPASALPARRVLVGRHLIHPGSGRLTGSRMAVAPMAW